MTRSRRWAAARATLGLVALAACAAALTLLLVRYVERRGGAASEPPALLEPAPLVSGLGAGSGGRGPYEAEPWA